MIEATTSHGEDAFGTYWLMIVRVDLLVATNLMRHSTPHLSRVALSMSRQPMRSSSPGEVSSVVLGLRAIHAPHPASFPNVRLIRYWYSNTSNTGTGSTGI